MDSSPPDYYLVVDLEATCNNNDSFPRTEMEIIEIGAVLLERKSLKIVEEFQSFIRPVRHPVLTEFCTNLTTISQSAVEAADSFPVVASRFESWFAPFNPLLFSSWGSYDRSQLLQDYQYHQLDFPLGEEHLNIKARFAKQLHTRRQMGMASALKKAGLPLIGTHHRGIDDARNISRLLIYLLGQDS